MVARRDDLLQPLAVGVESLQLVEGADRPGQRGEQLDPGELALALVVVDVVTRDRLQLRCLARLAGAQDDARVEELEVVADRVDGAQAGVVALHHHVEQDDGDVLVLAQEGQRLGTRVGVQELQRPVEDLRIGEREARRLVDVGVVVDDQNAPRIALRRWPVFGGVGVLCDENDVVVIGTQ